MSDIPGVKTSSWLISHKHYNYWRYLFILATTLIVSYLFYTTELKYNRNYDQNSLWVRITTSILIRCNFFIQSWKYPVIHQKSENLDYSYSIGSVSSYWTPFYSSIQTEIMNRKRNLIENDTNIIMNHTITSILSNNSGPITVNSSFVPLVSISLNKTTKASKATPSKSKLRKPQKSKNVTNSRHYTRTSNRAINVHSFNVSRHLLHMIKEMFHEAERDPDRLIRKLNETDPFETKVEDPSTYKCPDQRFPVYFNRTLLTLFKDGKSGYYVFFQHLRKAGGTSFCDLARNNMRYSQTPPFYCMPDKRGALVSPPWNSTAYINRIIHTKKYRIVANEYDVFYDRYFGRSNAIYATTIRDPIERWYSHYRFEHLEYRDDENQTTPRLSLIEWYNDVHTWNIGPNYYVKTFTGEQVNDFRTVTDIIKAKNTSFYVRRESLKYWTYRAYEWKYQNRISWHCFVKAIENVSKFSLILILEWLRYDISHQMIESILGWKQRIKQVLPHENEAKRHVKKSISVYDGITEEEYMYIARQNVFDVLFYAVVRRIVLERLVCPQDL